MQQNNKTHKNGIGGGGEPTSKNRRWNQQIDDFYSEALPELIQMILRSLSHFCFNFKISLCARLS